jgi:hypothetical protein
MRNLIFASIALSTSLAFAQSKTAPTAAPMAMTPPAELKALDYFAGSWTCISKVEAGPMGPAHQVTTHAEAKWELGNYWLHFHGDEEKSKENPVAKQADVYLGYDAASKKYPALGVFFGGGWMANGSSTGWEGDKIVWTGDVMMMGKKSTSKHTFTKKSDTEYSTLVEHAGADGKMMKAAEETCKKKPKK